MGKTFGLGGIALEEPESTGDYREMLVEKHHAASQDFDKLAVTLAGGALGLSVTFIHDIAPNPRHGWVVLIAWASLTVSLVFVFLSLLTSQDAIRDLIEKMDKESDPIKLGPGARRTLSLNIGAAITLVVGLAFLVIFALVNL
jgi:hypothetical protein